VPDEGQLSSIEYQRWIDISPPTFDQHEQASLFYVVREPSSIDFPAVCLHVAFALLLWRRRREISVLTVKKYPVSTYIVKTAYLERGNM
jgi:hypothetical protein